MGLIILFAVGGIIGWLASIVLRREDTRDILHNIAAGVAGSVVGGALTSSVSVLGGLSATALLVAFAAGALAVAAYNLFRHGALASS